MRVLITGITGMLGYDLWRTLSIENEVYGVSRNPAEFLPEKNWIQLDLTDAENTYHAISKINPDVLIHCAAYTDVDGCEREADMAYKLNVLATRNVCVACQRFDTAMVYISTDYVFDGENAPEDGYSEFDTPNPLSVYGKTKYEGEKIVKHMLNKFYIVRTAWLFGIKRENFISTIVKKMRNQETITAVTDQIGSPTYTKDLAEKIKELITKPIYGLYHITNKGKATRLEIVEEISKLLNLKPRLNLITREKVYFAKRPKNSSLNNYMLKLENIKEPRDWKEALKDFVTNESLQICKAL